MRDRHVGGDAVDDHDDRRRNQDAERARSGQRSEHQLVVVAAAGQLGHGDAADGRGRGSGRTGHRGEDAARQHVGVREPPGRRDSHGARPENIRSASRVRNRISPIQMKSGSAVSAQSVLPPNTVVASRAPGVGVGEERHGNAADHDHGHRDPQPSGEEHEQQGGEDQARLGQAIAHSLRSAGTATAPVGRDAAAQNRDQVVEERDRNQRDAQRHAAERKPLRDRDRADRVARRSCQDSSVVCAGGPGEPRADRGGRREAGDLERGAQPWRRALDEQRHADVRAGAQREREAEESARRHRQAGEVVGRREPGCR